MPNVIPDFPSLLQTRWVLRRLEAGGRVALVIVDLVITTVIALACQYLVGPSHERVRPDDELQRAASARVVRRGFNAGLHLLRALTDLGEQPFRSLGLAAVLIATIIFLAGIPLIVLI